MTIYPVLTNIYQIIIYFLSLNRTWLFIDFKETTTPLKFEISSERTHAQHPYLRRDVAIGVLFGSAISVVIMVSCLLPICVFIYCKSKDRLGDMRTAISQFQRGNSSKVEEINSESDIHPTNIRYFPSKTYVNDDAVSGNITV